MSILEEFYNGRIHPNEGKFRRDARYLKCNKIISESLKELTDFLSDFPETKRLFEQFVEAKSEANYMDGCDCFINGWKLGAKFILETFDLG